MGRIAYQPQPAYWRARSHPKWAKGRDSLTDAANDAPFPSGIVLKSARRSGFGNDNIRRCEIEIFG
jgi:hypothetical protein